MADDNPPAGAGEEGSKEKILPAPALTRDETAPTPASEPTESTPAPTAVPSAASSLSPDSSLSNDQETDRPSSTRKADNDESETTSEKVKAAPIANSEPAESTPARPVPSTNPSAAVALVSSSTKDEEAPASSTVDGCLKETRKDVKTKAKAKESPTEEAKGKPKSSELEKFAGGDVLGSDSERSEGLHIYPHIHPSTQLNDLEWQHELTPQPPVAASPSPPSPKDQSDSAPLGSTLLAERGEMDQSRQVDQSVNLNAAFDRDGDGDNADDKFENDDSFDNHSPTTSTKSGMSSGVGLGTSGRGRSRKRFAAPGRPTKYATRPSHVNIGRGEGNNDNSNNRPVERDVADSSLIGVVEGRVIFHRNSMGKNNLMMDPEIAAAMGGPHQQRIKKKRKTTWDHTKKSLVVLLKVAIVAGFVAYGVYIIASYTAPGSVGNSEATKDGLWTEPSSINTATLSDDRNGEVPNTTTIHIPPTPPTAVGEEVKAHVSNDSSADQSSKRSGEIRAMVKEVVAAAVVGAGSERDNNAGEVKAHVSHHSKNGSNSDAEIQAHVAHHPSDRRGEIHVESSAATERSGDNGEGKAHVSYHPNMGPPELHVSSLVTDGDPTATEGGDVVDITIHVSRDSDIPDQITMAVQAHAKIYSLEQIILQNEVSLPSLLNYSSRVETNLASANPQMEALVWLARSDNDIDAMDASQHEKLLQRYALGVLYFSLGGQYQQHTRKDQQQTPPPLSSYSQMARDVHLEHPSEAKETSSYRGWTRKSKWMSTVSHCQWYGIHCDHNEIVTSLNLTNNGLKGPLPVMELFQALRASLEVFDLSFNEISGSISQLPASIGTRRWARLEYFYINANQISGSPPLAWFGMSTGSSVVGINMAQNQLSGKVQGISNLQKLSELYLSHNLLSHTVPMFSNLSSLAILHLNHNSFTGSLPDGLCHMPSLVDLNAEHNFLNGSIPLDLPLLKDLEFLSLGHNNITGHLPDLFNSLTSLVSLDLSYNSLAGPLPQSLGNVTTIETVALNYNQFSGTLPADYATMTKLESFLLHHNDVYGSIPIEFCRLKAGFFNLRNLNNLQVDCLHKMVCECCDECY